MSCRVIYSPQVERKRETGEILSISDLITRGTQEEQDGVCIITDSEATDFTDCMERHELPDDAGYDGPKWVIEESKILSSNLTELTGAEFRSILRQTDKAEYAERYTPQKEKR